MGTISPSRARPCGAMNYWAEFLKTQTLAAASDNFAAFRLYNDPLLPPVPGDATLSVKARMAFPRNGGEEWFPQDFILPLYLAQSVACSATQIEVEGVSLAVKPGERYVIVDVRYCPNVVPGAKPEPIFDDDDDLDEYDGEAPVVLTVPAGTREIVIRFED